MAGANGAKQNTTKTKKRTSLKTNMGGNRQGRKMALTNDGVRRVDGRGNRLPCGPDQLKTRGGIRKKSGDGEPGSSAGVGEMIQDRNIAPTDINGRDGQKTISASRGHPK